MKRYAASRRLECRTLMCPSTLDVTGAPGGQAEIDEVNRASWTAAPPDENHYIPASKSPYICKACTEKQIANTPTV